MTRDAKAMLDLARDERPVALTTVLSVSALGLKHSSAQCWHHRALSPGVRSALTLT